MVASRRRAGVLTVDKGVDNATQDLLNRADGLYRWSHDVPCVVSLSRYRVSQDLIGLDQVTQPQRGTRIAWMAIRMMIQHQPSVGSADRQLGGVVRNPEDGVIIQSLSQRPCT